jgi:hypothetical protein
MLNVQTKHCRAFGRENADIEYTNKAQGILAGKMLSD